MPSNKPPTGPSYNPSWTTSNNKSTYDNPTSPRRTPHNPWTPRNRESDIQHAMQGSIYQTRQPPSPSSYTPSRRDISRHTSHSPSTAYTKSANWDTRTNTPATEYSGYEHSGSRYDGYAGEYRSDRLRAEAKDFVPGRRGWYGDSVLRGEAMSFYKGRLDGHYERRKGEWEGDEFFEEGKY
ncbi:hypothetical protein P280DRAFT_477381 [Massarina eburnea CBS 473.64]|uniref:Uncharacterized protein n=1 Tax=Massarina eburnea CBS 473.64 TaxID=1395130 RepID=A0A6A6S8C8_9PLEO|nr:hypothetical protein P280DRAFT_477381 [Massarina eburnea CBS 473.64]